MNETVVAAVIFPANLPFFVEFVSSLQDQSCKNFDLLLLNDGCLPGDIEKSLLPCSFQYEIVSAIKGSPALIRGQLIEILKNSDYDIIIFGDTDDFFSSNRLELCIEAIQEDQWDIAFNDLTVVSEESVVIRPKIWQDRKETSEVDIDFLLRCNALGLGNTAIRKSLLDFELKLDPDIPAFDWTFYIQIFKNNKTLKCGFLKDVTTSYRQHSRNTLGISDSYSREKLEFLAKTKASVLHFAVRMGILEANKQLDDLDNFRNTYLENDKLLEEKIRSLNTQKDLFWFEETIYNS
ncbi:MAG: glycosyltransferase family 2 protein [Eudoraea sp.]|nr:glycosyltransferase family 2 protein [Eudoraea sp.]